MLEWEEVVVEMMDSYNCTLLDRFEVDSSLEALKGRLQQYSKSKCCFYIFNEFTTIAIRCLLSWNPHIFVPSLIIINTLASLSERVKIKTSSSIRSMVILGGSNFKSTN